MFLMRRKDEPSTDILLTQSAIYIYIYMYQVCYGGDIPYFKICLEIPTHAADVVEKPQNMSKGTRSKHTLLLLAAYKDDIASESSYM
jgi:hypothetical protein